MSFNVAIIGYGGMGSYHAKFLNDESHGLSRVAGVFDVRDEARSGAAEAGFHLYASPEELYADGGIDVVLIATPNNFHAPYAKACLRSGKNVVSEKPVCMDAAELEGVLAVARESGKFFTTHQNRRWDTDYLTMRSAVETGLIARPYVVESRVQSANGMIHGWRCFKEHGGGMVYDWGAHLIDQMLQFEPSALVEVGAVLHRVIADEVDDAFTATFRFESGLEYRVNISMNCFISQPRWHVCSVDGSLIIPEWDGKGRIVKNAGEHVSEWTETITYTAAGPTRSMAPRPTNTLKELAPPIVARNCFETFYSNIAQAVRGEAEPLVAPAHMLRAMRAIDMVFEADRQKQSVKCRL